MKYLIFSLAIVFLSCSGSDGTSDNNLNNSNNTGGPLYKSFKDNRPRPDGDGCINEFGDCVETSDGFDCFCIGEVIDYQPDIEGEGGCDDENGDCYISPDNLNIGGQEVFPGGTGCQEVLYNRCMPHPISYGIGYTEYGICYGFGENLFSCYCMNGDFIQLSELVSSANTDDILKQFCGEPVLVNSCSSELGNCDIFEEGFVCYCSADLEMPVGMDMTEGMVVSAPRIAHEQTCEQNLEFFCTPFEGK